MAVTIIIADDHDIIRKGIRNILHANSDYKVVGEAADGEEVLAKVKKLRPDVLLLDISMPKISGLEVIEQVHYISPRTKIIIISMHKSPVYIMKAVQSGVKGYLQKENAAEELLPALVKVVSGNIYLTSSVSAYLMEKSLQKSTEQTGETQFTSREQEILRLVVEGKTAREISENLFISVRTVENYKNAILKKLNLHRTSDLIKYAIKHRIVDIDEY